MKITIDASYSISSSTDVDIPIEDWNHIRGCFVKWDVFHYTLDNVEWKEVPLNDVSSQTIDFKRPSNLSIFNQQGDELFSNFRNF